MGVPLVPHEAEVNAMACHRCMLSWRAAVVVGDAKDFAYALDELGVRRSIRLARTFAHRCLGPSRSSFARAFLCADVIREPNITPEHLKSAKLLVNQGRRSIEMTLGIDVITFVACMPRLLSIEVHGCEVVVEAANPNMLLEDWAHWSGCQGGRGGCRAA